MASHCLMKWFKPLISAVFFSGLMALPAQAASPSYYQAPSISTGTGLAVMWLAGSFEIHRTTNDPTSIIIIGSTSGVRITYGIVTTTAQITGLLSGAQAAFSSWITASSGAFTSTMSAELVRFSSAVINNVSYTFPGGDGSSGQVLSTNGFGTLSWITASGGGGSGASSLAVATGTNIAANIISSPTALINLSKFVFKVKFISPATAFLDIDYSSVTAQGDILAAVKSSTQASMNFISTAQSSAAIRIDQHEVFASSAQTFIQAFSTGFQNMGHPVIIGSMTAYGGFTSTSGFQVAASTVQGVFLVEGGTFQFRNGSNEFSIVFASGGYAVGDRLIVSQVTGNRFMIASGKAITDTNSGGVSGGTTWYFVNRATDAFDMQNYSISNSSFISGSSITATGIVTSTNGFIGNVSSFTGVGLPAGALDLATLYWRGDRRTGFYSPLANQIGITAAATSVGIFSNSGLSMSLPIFVANGSLSQPTYSWSNETNSGRSRLSGGIFDESVGGSRVYQFTNSSWSATVPLVALSTFNAFGSTMCITQTVCYVFPSTAPMGVGQKLGITSVSGIYQYLAWTDDALGSGGANTGPSYTEWQIAKSTVGTTLVASEEGAALSGGNITAINLIGPGTASQVGSTETITLPNATWYFVGRATDTLNMAGQSLVGLSAISSTFTTIYSIQMKIANLVASSTDSIVPVSTFTYANPYQARGLVPMRVGTFDGSAINYAYGDFVCPTNIDVSSTVYFTLTVIPKTAGANKNVQFIFQSTAASANGDGVYSYNASTGADACALNGSTGTLNSCHWSDSVSHLNWMSEEQIFFALGRTHNTVTNELSGVLYGLDLKIEIPVSHSHRP